MHDLCNSNGQIMWFLGSCHVNREAAFFEKQKQYTELYHLNDEEQSICIGY